MGQKKSVSFMEELLHIAMPNVIIVPLINLFVCFLIIPSFGYGLYTIFCAFFVIQSFSMYAVFYYGLGNVGVFIFFIISFAQLLFNVVLNLISSGTYNAKL